MPKFGVPTDEQLAKINKLAKRTLSADEVFVFPDKLAGDMIIPDRYVQLTKELLDVFAADAKKGVSILLDHSWAPDGFFGLGGRPKAAIPYGRTFDSKFEGSTEEGETVSLMADHYMARGIELDGIKTDDLVASIEAGTLFDSSIGFSYSKAICSVCGGNYRSSECGHYAGRTYEIEDEDGVTRQKLCYIKAKPPGFLMENSLVFDGAYPGAGVMSKAGEIFENETGIYQTVSELKGIDPVKALISTYSSRVGLITMVKKSDHKKVHSLGSIDDKNAKGGEIKMNEKVLKMLEAFGMKISDEFKPSDETTEVFNTLAEKWDSTVQAIKDSATPLKSAEGEPTLSVGDIVFPKVYLEKEFGKALSSDELTKLAKEGQEYRKQLIDEALAMGVRAMGNDFTKETWEKTFGTMGIQAIKDIMKTWENQANVGIPAGRQTDPAAGQKQSVSIPDEAFKVGK
jgi:hypothetical protein